MTGFVGHVKSQNWSMFSLPKWTADRNLSLTKINDFEPSKYQIKYSNVTLIKGLAPFYIVETIVNRLYDLSKSPKYFLTLKKLIILN